MVISAVLAPRRSISAFVASVVPWMIMVTSAGAMPAAAQTFCRPSRIARSGSRPVVSTFTEWTVLAAFEHDVGEGSADVDPDLDPHPDPVRPGPVRHAAPSRSLLTRIGIGKVLGGPARRRPAIWPRFQGRAATSGRMTSGVKYIGNW